MRFSIYDTKTSNEWKWVTGELSRAEAERTLMLWKSHHPDKDLSHFVVKERIPEISTDPEFMSLLLIVDRETEKVICWFHWENRHYAKALDTRNIYAKASVPFNLSRDINPIYVKGLDKLWDGK